jgi:hypothetical protein
MKYLSDYTQAAQSALFEEMGVFFAFSDEQFDEQAVKGVDYAPLPMGGICPTKNRYEFLKRHYALVDKGMADDVAENGIKKIIHRELGNHECQIAMDITDAVDVLSSYGITREQVQAEWAEYFQNCIDNDYF